MVYLKLITWNFIALQSLLGFRVPFKTSCKASSVYPPAYFKKKEEVFNGHLKSTVRSAIRNCEWHEWFLKISPAAILLWTDWLVSGLIRENMMEPARWHKSAFRNYRNSCNVFSKLVWMCFVRRWMCIFHRMVDVLCDALPLCTNVTNSPWCTILEMLMELENDWFMPLFGLHITNYRK